MTIHAFKRIVAATAMAMAMSLLGACKSGGDEDTGDAKIRRSMTMGVLNWTDRISLKWLL